MIKKINILIYAKILILNLMIICWRLDVVGEDLWSMQLKSIRLMLPV